MNGRADIADLKRHNVSTRRYYRPDEWAGRCRSGQGQRAVRQDRAQGWLDRIAASLIGA